MTAPDPNDMADAIESMLPALKRPPKPGHDRRVLWISLEDTNADGCETDQVIELELGEPELIIAALRAYNPNDIGGN